MAGEGFKFLCEASKTKCRRFPVIAQKGKEYFWLVYDKEKGKKVKKKIKKVPMMNDNPKKTKK